MLIILQYFYVFCCIWCCKQIIFCLNVQVILVGLFFSTLWIQEILLIKTGMEKTFFSVVTHFIIAYHISLVKVQTNYFNNNLLILVVKQINKIMKFDYFNTLMALWDDQGKMKMFCGISRVKKQLSGKRSILCCFS